MVITVANAGRTFVVVGLLFVVLTPAMSQVPSPATKASDASDREQITAILRSWEEAWNSHDMRAFAKLFHEDGVWVLWTGAVGRGGPPSKRATPPSTRLSSATAFSANASKS